MSDKIKVVNLVGEVVLSTIPDHRVRIEEAFKERSTVLASLSQVEDIDLFGVQLLYAARRYAKRTNKEFYLTGEVPELVARRLHETGFVDTVIRDGRALDRSLHEFGSVPQEDSNDA
ncbi:MAG TPA: STAS domain-containing protein [Alkalispirochaeta sp.]|nr:STAS domain-containing protein [Alkalispirochaeta sp.]